MPSMIPLVVSSCILFSLRNLPFHLLSQCLSVNFQSPILFLFTSLMDFSDILCSSINDMGPTLFIKKMTKNPIFKEKNMKKAPFSKKNSLAKKHFLLIKRFPLHRLVLTFLCLFPFFLLSIYLLILPYCPTCTAICSSFSFS